MTAAVLLLLAAAAAPRELTLEEAVDLALRNQPQLAQARAGTEAADARSRQALSPLLPQVSANAGYRKSTVTGGPNANLLRSPNDTGGLGTLWDAGLTVNQLIWDFGQTGGKRGSALASAEAKAADERQTVIDVARNVRVAYFDARTKRELVGVAQANLTSQDAHLKQIRGFVEVGSRPEIDLSQARSDVANARVLLIQAQADSATSKSRLDQAMGVREHFAYEVADASMAPVEGEDAELDVLVAEALKTRPDAAAIEAELRAQEELTRLARGVYLPSFGLALNANERGDSLADLTPAASAQLSLSWLIWPGGATKARVAESQALTAGIAAQREELRQQVRVQVDDARLKVHAGLEKVSATREASEAARDRLRLAEGRYQAGVGSSLELFDAQSTLTTTEAQRVQAEYELATARAELLAALGRR